MIKKGSLTRRITSGQDGDWENRIRASLRDEFPNPQREGCPEEELLKGLEGLTPPENQPEPEADMGDEED